MRRAAIVAFAIDMLATTPAVAAVHRSANPLLTFSGHCALSGAVQFDPPLTDEPQSIRDLADAQGTCSGTVTDRGGRTYHLDATPVRYLVEDQGSGRPAH